MKLRFLAAPAAVLLIGAGLALGACAPVIVGGAATAGVTVAQERSVGDAIDDATIKIELNALFFDADPGLFKDIGFGVVEGRVLLTGAVEDPADRVEAVRITWQVDGVREVIDEIQVTSEGGVLAYTRDVRISFELKAKLLFDGDVIDINYNIETVNGVVYLLGIAQSKVELDRVVDHARTIPYVKKVVSHVRLKDDPRRAASP